MKRLARVLAGLLLLLIVSGVLTHAGSGTTIGGQSGSDDPLSGAGDNKGGILLTEPITDRVASFTLPATVDTARALGSATINPAQVTAKNFKGVSTKHAQLLPPFGRLPVINWLPWLSLPVIAWLLILLIGLAQRLLNKNVYPKHKLSTTIS